MSDPRLAPHLRLLQHPGLSLIDSGHQTQQMWHMSLDQEKGAAEDKCPGRVRE